MSALPEVEALIPHRRPQRVIDRLLTWEGPRLIAEGRFSPDDVQGHFPGEPVVPGVVLIEGLAQALACLGRLNGEQGRALLTSIEGARFRALAAPPCTLTFEVEVVEQRFRVTTARGWVREGERWICTATLSAALLDAAALPGHARADAADS